MASDEEGGSWEQAQLCLRAGKRLIVADFEGSIAPGNRRLIDTGRVAALDPTKPRSVWTLLEEFAGPPQQTSLLG